MLLLGTTARRMTAPMKGGSKLPWLAVAAVSALVILLSAKLDAGQTSAATVASMNGGGQHTCSLTAAGGISCWGRNSDGQLGDGTTTQKTRPSPVAGLSAGVTQISLGTVHTCARLASSVKCWGANAFGELGDGTTTARSTPVTVCESGSGAGCPALGSISSVAAGGRHTCVLTTTGGVKCWGLNTDGQLGNGTTTSTTLPVDASGLSTGVTAIAAGDSHTCALLQGEPSSAGARICTDSLATDPN
jgi:alpha-tubulin suppressor-like RCC1 family protein